MPEPKKFDEDTHTPTWADSIAAITDTAGGGPYGATEQTMLANLKTAVNAIISALKAAGIIQQD